MLCSKETTLSEIHIFLFLFFALSFCWCSPSRWTPSTCSFPSFPGQWVQKEIPPCLCWFETHVLYQPGVGKATPAFSCFFFFSVSSPSSFGWFFSVGVRGRQKQLAILLSFSPSWWREEWDFCIVSPALLVFMIWTITFSSASYRSTIVAIVRYGIESVYSNRRRYQFLFPMNENAVTHSNLEAIDW